MQTNTTVGMRNPAKKLATPTMILVLDVAPLELDEPGDGRMCVGRGWVGLEEGRKHYQVAQNGSYQSSPCACRRHPFRLRQALFAPRLNETIKDNTELHNHIPHYAALTGCCC
eukprot:scpid106943/ scgid8429/ 